MFGERWDLVLKWKAMGRSKGDLTCFVKYLSLFIAEIEGKKNGRIW